MNEKTVYRGFWIPTGKILRDFPVENVVRANLFSNKNVFSLVSAGFGKFDKNMLEVFRRYNEHFSNYIRYSSI